MMPFGQKNVRVTYQQLVNTTFRPFIGKTMEVYVDNMLTENLRAADHVSDLKKTFDILRKYQMKLNPEKYIVGVSLGKFLAFIVKKRGIEVKPEKIWAIMEIGSPQSVKEM